MLYPSDDVFMLKSISKLSSELIDSVSFSISDNEYY